MNAYAPYILSPNLSSAQYISLVAWVGWTDGRTLFDLFKKVFNNDTKFIHGKREIPHRQFDIGVARGIYQRINEEKYAEDHPELFEWE